MSIRLVIADDHPLILNGLETLLHLEPDIEVRPAVAMGKRPCNRCADTNRIC